MRCTYNGNSRNYEDEAWKNWSVLLHTVKKTKSTTKKASNTVKKRRAQKTQSPVPKKVTKKDSATGNYYNGVFQHHLR